MNEELETSREEMQSLNEELQIVNGELHGRLDELSRANSDMKNLLNATNIATIFLDQDLCITRYTEQAKKIVPLIATDIGRNIADLVSSLHYEHLVEDAREILRTLQAKEIEVRGSGEAQYLIRMLPYRTTDNVIDGVVLTFVDITKVKALQEEQTRLLQVLRNTPASVFGQDRDFRFIWNCSSLFGRGPDDLIGKTDRDVFEPDDAGKLAAFKQQVLSTGEPARRRIELAIRGQPRLYDLYVEPKRDAAGQVVGISCFAMDITAHP